MSKRTTLKVAALDPKLKREDVEALIADIGDRQRRIAAMRAEADTAKAAIDAALAGDLAPIETSLKSELAVVFAWATANRSALCPAGSKTVKLQTGEICWRMTPKSVALTGAGKIIAALKKRGLLAFIRVKEKVDKQAILKDPAAVAAIPGIVIGQHEELVVTPHQSEIQPIELTRKVAA